MEVGEVGLHGPAVEVTAEDPTPDPVTTQLLPMEDQTVLESVDTLMLALETVVQVSTFKHACFMLISLFQIKITEFMVNGDVGHLGQVVEVLV